MQVILLESVEHLGLQGEIKNVTAGYARNYLLPRQLAQRATPKVIASKKELLDYIFKPESDGRTKYQREYASNVQHLIDSAFFTKDKDKNTLVTKAKQSAKSEAYKELHQKIKASKGKRQKSSGGQNEGGEVSDTLSKLGHSLIRKV